MTVRTSLGCLGLAATVALIACVLPGCGADEFDRATWIERGEKAVTPFKQKLMGALLRGLEDGPEAAIEVCQLLAPEIAQEVSSPGVRLGRTSHKLRSERNAPRAWVQPLLARYVATPGESGPDAVPLEDGGVGYVEPIYVKQMCLACHGSALSPEIASRIDEHYPHDEARGFEEGDFRGLFWVEFSEVAGQAAVKEIAAVKMAS